MADHEILFGLKVQQINGSLLVIMPMFLCVWILSDYQTELCFILGLIFFVDFAVLSQTVKILTLKYISKHIFSLRNAVSPHKFILE